MDGVSWRAGASAAVADGSGQCDGGGAERFAHLRGQGDRGRFFPHFLPAPLQRAIAFEAVNDVIAVAEYLDLDMAR